MTARADFDLLTIGHSNLPADRFMALVQEAGICAEREPLDCHRCLLVGRALAVRGLRLGHILVDGTTEPHAAIEERLLGRAGGSDDLFGGRNVQLARAYRARAAKVAARLRP